MKNLSRRQALRGATAAAAIAAVPVTAVANDPLREGVQALVDELRGPAPEKTTLGDFFHLHEVADRLEALPGIEPVRNDMWEGHFKPRRAAFGVDRLLAALGEV